MRKNLLTTAVLMMATLAITGCGKVDRNLRVEPTEVVIEVERQAITGSGISYDIIKSLSFMKSTPTKEQEFVDFDDFLAANDVMDDVKKLKADAQKQGGKMNVISTQTKMELEFTYEEQLTETIEDIESTAKQLASDVMAQRATFESLGAKVLEYVKADNIIIVVSYYDKDGTELYYKELPFSRK